MPFDDPEMIRKPERSMETVRIIQTEERYVESFHKTVGIVARERRYIGFVEPPSLEMTRGFVRRILQDGGVQVLAVTPDEAVVGWCDIVRKALEGFRHSGTLGMGLLPEYRGQGLGERLAVEAIRSAQRIGIERIELDVFASNARAIALYRKLGFVVEGVKRRARKLDGAYEDNVFMALVTEPDNLNQNAGEGT
jgi:ribosomal protein S18 acetylase RimI-like enzyme